ncbi:hypothetical protein [Paenibacillus paeoniae]|uniref:Uncharacterized protein n=1 Tax=Paenibacillus paeoniae TaxID=2292705 RepID=A0A371PGB6_9BACL|nr:hypothetical protein [Paenibacillus paeoniae]REK74598.1 hypothetical protein DX130_12955 [Paenibacillus paeoniae]
MKRLKIVPPVLLMFIMIFISACSNHNSDAVQSYKTVIHSDLLLVNYNKNDLVRDADVIIRGIVKTQVVKKDFDHFPVTDTTIVVKKVYKGTPEQEVIVRTKGGQLEDTLHVPQNDAIPQFKKQDDVIVFLTNQTGDRPDKDQLGYYVVGQIQGKFDVVKNKHLEGVKVEEYGFRLKELQDQIKVITIENENNPPK